MSESGQVLRIYNEKIVRCLNELKNQRNEIKDLIEKQLQEKTRLQTEIERITYKLMIINKSVTQRISTLEDYERTIKEAEEQYYGIVNDSGKLVDRVEQYVTNLEGQMDKKVGTDSKNVDEIKDMLIEKRLTEKDEESKEDENAEVTFEKTEETVEETKEITEEAVKDNEEKGSEEKREEEQEQEGSEESDGGQSLSEKFYDELSLSDKIRSLTPSTCRIPSSRSTGNYSNPIARLAREHNASREDNNSS